MQKLDVRAVSLALGIVSAVGYILCGLFVVITPNLALKFFSKMFHAESLDIFKASVTTITLGNFLVGLIETVVLTVVGGAFFSVLYNYFAGEKKE